MLLQGTNLNTHDYVYGASNLRRELRKERIELHKNSLNALKEADPL